MNTYDLKCYKKTYKDAKYWDRIPLDSEKDRQQIWGECRGLTNRFYDELVSRGYLVRQGKY